MYSDHFGLSGQPFQLTPDARFWFGSRTHRKAMAYLGYGLAQGEGFIVVTGEVGAGKSTLVGHLLATIDRSRLNALSIVSTQVEGDDMLRLVAQGLGLATAGIEKAQLLDLVERRLDEEARAGKRTLLIVDEAQNLPVSALEELRMLSNFQIGGRALVQIFLLGQPEFRDKLSSSEGLEQLRQRVIANHHLDAMGSDEIEAYVAHRLKLVGWQGRPAFADDAWPAIHGHTDGIPRRVNQLANRLMLFAAVEGQEEIGAFVVDSVVADLAGERLDVRAAFAERVLPLRSVGSTPTRPRAVPEPVQQEPAPVADFALERRVAALEARVQEQEGALRRVLAMLVDWVENADPGYRSNAA
ncbi:MAG: ral secretion pathway protein [Sphingomonadales bacterium]|jgi:putative secretion ATPase (PEP-CTERM system associated)|nr:ral secretion pathway protein [Sphingomonadales bacterium]